MQKDIYCFLSKSQLTHLPPCGQGLRPARGLVHSYRWRFTTIVMPVSFINQVFVNRSLAFKKTSLLFSYLATAFFSEHKPGNNYELCRPKVHQSSAIPPPGRSRHLCTSSIIIMLKYLWGKKKSVNINIYLSIQFSVPFFIKFHLKVWRPFCRFLNAPQTPGGNRKQ